MDEPLAATALGALGNEVRLKLFRLLVRAGDEGMPVSDIQHFIGVPLSTLSHHIKTLVQSGLVVQERKGREIISKINFDAMHELLGFLTEECCVGVKIETTNAA